MTARRGAETLICEVKGHVDPGWASPDVDILYGQLVRRMASFMGEGDPLWRRSARTDGAGGLRVPEHVRDLLDVDVFLANDFGRVRLVEQRSSRTTRFTSTRSSAVGLGGFLGCADCDVGWLPAQPAPDLRVQGVATILPLSTWALLDVDSQAAEVH